MECVVKVLVATMGMVTKIKIDFIQITNLTIQSFRKVKKGRVKFGSLEMCMFNTGMAEQYNFLSN